MAQQAVQGTKEWRQPSRFVISVIPGLRNQLAYKPKLSEPLSQLRKASVAQHGFKKRSPGTATHPGGTQKQGCPEKRKNIHQQLVTLLHAQNCLKRESRYSTTVLNCSMPHCTTMKNVLKHMDSCQAGDDCPVPLCSSSRQIINNWKDCTPTRIPVRLPLKQADKTQTNNLGAVGAGTRQTRIDSTVQRLVVPNVLLPFYGPNQIAAVARQVPLTTRPRSTAITIVAPGTNIQQGLLDKNQFGNLQLPSGLQPSSVTATPVQGTKEWQQSVTLDLRSHLVDKLVRAFFRTPIKPQSMLDKRMENIVSHAKKVEGEMYVKADSRSEYDLLLSDKIYQIQRAIHFAAYFKEQRQKREEQQLQAQQQQHDVDATLVELLQHLNCNDNSEEDA